MRCRRFWNRSRVRVCLPEGCDAHVMLRNLRQLEEEDPQLRVVWNERLGEIHLQLMGEVQLEILPALSRNASAWM